jgi:dihydrofolate synthase / folylpolyglutamate synthase
VSEQDPLAFVFGLEQFGIKFGLDNIRTIVRHLGNPQLTYPTIHVAGTNGKGSVTAMVDTAFRAAGYHTGRYTSPHLIDISERFVIDGQPIGAAPLHAAAADVRDAIQSLHATGRLDVLPTYFEATTAIAFELFRRARVDVATIEVGLGGRLDATNVICPVACAITSIGFDHEQYLGRTLADIAREKAGILKAGIPVVVGALRPEARHAIDQRAADVGAPVIDAAEGVSVTMVDRVAPRVRLRTAVHDYGETSIGLRGTHQAANAIVAVRLLETVSERGVNVPADAIRDGLANVSWPGRLDVRTFGPGRDAILDAAHNEEGAAALAEYLTAVRVSPLPVVFGAMKDKDAGAMFRILLPHASTLIVTRAATPRAADPEVLAEQARRVRPTLEVIVEPSLGRALDTAWARAARIVVAGSIFLLGDVYKEFGGLPSPS